jgi:hypothetical protein
MHQEGKFKAIVQDATLEENNDGGLRVVVMFATEKNDSVRWSGSLSTDKSQDFCLEQLARLGWKGKSVEELAVLTGMDLDCKKEFEIIIEHTITEKGKTFANVKYINEAKPVLESNYKLEKLKALGLANKLSGQKVTTKKVSSESLHKNDPREEDIPF